MQALFARAEVRVTGEPEAVKIEATEASAEELLIELSNTFGLRYRSTANLSRSFSGTFDGPLQQAVSRVLLLQGYNFGVETSANGITVAVFGKDPLHGNTVGSATYTPTTPPNYSPNSSRHGLPNRAQGQGHGKPWPVARMNKPHSTSGHRLQVAD
jgi:hypothetical protein